VLYASVKLRSPLLFGVVCALVLFACGRATERNLPGASGGAAANSETHASGGDESTGSGSSDVEWQDTIEPSDDPCDCDDEDAEVRVTITYPDGGGGVGGYGGAFAHPMDQTFDHPPAPGTFGSDLSCDEYKRPTVFDGKNCAPTLLAACSPDGTCISITQPEWGSPAEVKIADSVPISLPASVFDASASEHGELSEGHFMVTMDDGGLLTVEYKACYATRGRCLG